MTAAEAMPASIAAGLREGAGALAVLLASRLREAPGYDLLTILALNAAGDRLVRLYSSNLQHYPLGDADLVQDDRWFRRLFVEKAPVVANSEAAIREWLPDFHEFEAMGYRSLLNLPVIVSGTAVGILNLMAGRDHFTARAVASVAGEAPIAALAILAGEAPKRKLFFL